MRGIVGILMTLALMGVGSSNYGQYRETPLTPDEIKRLNTIRENKRRQLMKLKGMKSYFLTVDGFKLEIPSLNDDNALRKANNALAQLGLASKYAATHILKGEIQLGSITTTGTNVNP